MAKTLFEFSNVARGFERKEAIRVEPLKNILGMYVDGQSVITDNDGQQHIAYIAYEDLLNFQERVREIGEKIAPLNIAAYAPVTGADGLRQIVSDVASLLGISRNDAHSQSAPSHFSSLDI